MPRKPFWRDDLNVSDFCTFDSGERAREYCLQGEGMAVNDANWQDYRMQ